MTADPRPWFRIGQPGQEGAAFPPGRGVALRRRQIARRRRRLHAAPGLLAPEAGGRAGGPELVAELQGALDACTERQLQLEQSLRVCRRLLQAWEPTGTRASEPPLGPETNEEDPPPACTHSPQDLKELEFLTQALEKAVRVRRGITKTGETDKAPSLKSRSTVAPPGTIAFAPPQTPGRAGGHASDTRPTKGPCQTTVPAKGHSERQLLSLGDNTRVRTGARAPRPGPGLRDQQMAPSAAPQAPKVFTLKEKG
ncbi:Tubulin epsilon and delta complex protein 2 [Saguinus oedipus]|uniref:Tubulin epsilon and delta complex protein 2 n=1 Tax=Saguinus oedipus TaxID=9490 RepID=A0ABQ9UKK1_SAGOE|nr:Tubulin epsilon and delta complex protein 2 [Saguinus oedipus]